MSIKKNIKEYFSYSASEKRGLLVLLIILVAVLVIPSLFSSKPEELIVANENKMVDSLIAVLNKKNNVAEPKLFTFNPNDASVDDLTQLGLKKYQISNIVRYRDRGGVFKSKSDFRKIYGIVDKDYNRLKDYINIPIAIKTVKQRKPAKKGEEYKYFKFDPNTITKLEWKKLEVNHVISNRIIKYLSTGARFKSADDLGKIYGFDTSLLAKLKPYVQIKTITEKSEKRELIDLNLADTSILKTLPGIGKTLSKRIVKYKNLLGGYNNKLQLMEVYGLSKEIFEIIDSRICISAENLQKISINECSAKVLGKHPYINKRTSSDIIKYRERVGKFNSIEELKTKHLLSDSVFQKVEPYLIIQ